MSLAGASLAQWSPQAWPLAAGWAPVVGRFLASQEGLALAGFMRGRLAAGATIYPPEPFRALELTALADVRMVILGQDPYHGPGQAEGLAFSVAPGVRIPPSLRNIFKELGRDLGLPLPANGSLARWARQGVLLLNTCLTVEVGLAGSHVKHGWEVLTDEIVKAVAGRGLNSLNQPEAIPPCVYLLWGAHAQAKSALIPAGSSNALVLRANHPSPLSALRPPIPFAGCGHFSRARDWLGQHGSPLEY
jgi:uracil-DNA glycosylase